MTDERVRLVRSFNRTVTQRVGALQNQYLSRHRSLGASRLLWEIGPGGASLSSLRARLDLDSGYLSRLLRDLEKDGLTTVSPDESDGRERIARLTRAGKAEWKALDSASDDLAASILGALSPVQQERLVAAMDQVQKLLLASMVQVRILSPTHPHARFCLRSYVDELNTRFKDGFDPERSISADDGELTVPHGALMVATVHSEPVGCGALKFHPGGTAELKRMWTSPSVRGLGVGRRLLRDLEAYAHAQGVSLIRLETNRALREAIALYRSSGYLEVPAFNDEPYAHHWFEKTLGSAPSGTS